MKISHRSSDLDTEYQHENLALQTSQLFEVLWDDLVALQNEAEPWDEWMISADEDDWDILEYNQAA